MFKKFPRTFWVANLIELFERWGWYGLFNVLAIYLTTVLDFTQTQKGYLMGTITAMVYFLPVFTGAISDKVGYKKSLLVAFSLYFIGFFLMSKMSTYGAVFLSFAIVGLGAAIFKPIISATISKTTNEKNAILGFGIFYMMVNLGALIGPVLASKLRDVNWVYVFYSSMLAIAINILLVIFFYKEPGRVPNQDSVWESIKKIAKNIWVAILDWKFLIFLLLIVGFWTMYMQLFFTLPVFVEQWVDTSILYNALHKIWPWLADFIGNGKGEVNPEMLLNMDAFFIVVFQLIISSIVTKMKPIRAMVIGFFIASIGVSLMFMMRNPIFIVLAILIFSIGEMTGSPTITSYIGLIAPQDKKALYMGMSFLPVAGGNFLGGYISGSVYQNVADKATLALKYLQSKGIAVPEQLRGDEIFNYAVEKLHIPAKQLTDILWNTYRPDHIWYIFTSIGIITVIGLIIYDYLILRPKRKLETNNNLTH